MKTGIFAGVLALGALYAAAAQAFTLDCKSDKCDVKCDNGTLIGTMYWNGSVWSDGVRSNKDKNVVAQLMVQAWGTSCT